MVDIIILSSLIELDVKALSVRMVMSHSVPPPQEVAWERFSQFTSYKYLFMGFTVVLKSLISLFKVCWHVSRIWIWWGPFSLKAGFSSHFCSWWPHRWSTAGSQLSFHTGIPSLDASIYFFFQSAAATQFSCVHSPTCQVQQGPGLEIGGRESRPWKKCLLVSKEFTHCYEGKKETVWRKLGLLKKQNESPISASLTLFFFFCT